MVYATSIVVAAGRGSRMGTKEKKQYLFLKDKPLFIHTLELMEQQSRIKEIILVVPAEDLDFCKNLCNKYSINKIHAVVPGGETRGASVYNGLKAVPEHSKLVVVHDGARPFLSQEVLEKVIDAGEKEGAAVAAVPVKDTIKEVDPNNMVQKTLERKYLWAVQTPQVFKKDILMDCYNRAIRDGISGTDDAAIVEAYNYPVKLVMGDYNNIKITTKEDLTFANYILGG